MNVRLTRLAQADVAQAAEWYERERDGLGRVFLDRVEQAVGKLAENAAGYAKVIGDNRRCNLEKFPYVLWFKLQGEVIVLACLHGKRSPQLAKERALGITPMPRKPQASR